jgi:enoyl-CoA hydratase
MAETAEIICETKGAAGLMTLNRPQALNALTLGMVRAMRRVLDQWADDPQVTRVVVTGAGGRAFCAGGDIRYLYDLGRAGRYDEALVFWREEYALNVRIKRYPKPYIALIDGIVMGGGVGVSLHGSHRVAGDRYVFAMPEVGIGFFPDVGATYALPRLPGEAGLYLALTGERARAADALALGLATHAVPSGAFEDVQAALTAGKPIEAVLASASGDPGEASLWRERDAVDSSFRAESVTAILSRLDAAAENGSAFGAKTAATIRAKSPTSLCIAFEQMRRGGALDFEEAMRTEFRIASRAVEGHDFYEGVHAAIIDKDGAPNWRPPTLAEVREADVQRHFAPIGRELEIA